MDPVLIYRKVLFIGLVCLAACTNVVVPPAAPLRPSAVFLIDHGRHASLVLPGADSGAVRYSYGDWNYYALVKTGFFETSGAALWDTQAALGRRELSGPPTAAGVRRAVRVGIEDLYELTVESDEVRRLRRRLDGLFRANLETRVYNAAYDLEFVHHPRPYTAIYNSNRVVALWLRDLGCRVRGPLLFSRWRVERPERGDGDGDGPYDPLADSPPRQR